MKRNIMNFTISILIFCVLAEVIAKILNPYKPKPVYQDMVEADEIFGWFPRKNYSYECYMQDINKNYYEVKYSTTANGFRFFGNTSVRNKTRVFFLGDSYTQSVEASDDKVFYALIRDSLDIELFAFGMAGYGNLQEYMILKKYLPVIRPDIIVLQVCSNDFIDNHCELELEPGYRVGSRRPYLTVNGEIEYKSTEPWLKYINKSVNSRFIDFAQKKIDEIKKSNLKEEDMKEYKIPTFKRSYKLFDEAVAITDSIFGKISELVSDSVKLMVFTVSGHSPYADIYSELAERYGFIFSRAASYALWKAGNEGEIIHALDRYHWNHRGHRIVADALIPEIKELTEYE